MSVGVACGEALRSMRVRRPLAEPGSPLSHAREVLTWNVVWR